MSSHHEAVQPVSAMRLRILVSAAPDDMSLALSACHSLRGIDAGVPTTLVIATPSDVGDSPPPWLIELLIDADLPEEVACELINFREASSASVHIAGVSIGDRGAISSFLARLSHLLMLLKQGTMTMADLSVVPEGRLGESVAQYQPVGAYRRPPTSTVTTVRGLGVGHVDNPSSQIKTVEVDDPRVTIGRFTYCNTEVKFRLWQEWDRIEVGSFCSVGAGVQIYGGGNHRMDFVSTFPFRMAFGDPVRRRDGQLYGSGMTQVGNDVWLGDDSTVMSGVRIGHGAVVGAGSVVRGEVPPYSIVVGNPATVVRFRFSPDDISRLLKIGWWDWPINRIRDYSHLLSGPCISEFLTVAEKEAGYDHP